MENKGIKLIERPAFMAGITAVGGFCNAYTGMTRGGVFANAHTANMAKLGIAIATLNASDAFNAVVPIVGCFLGAVICELVKDKGDLLGGHWHQKALILELLALVAVGFIPDTVPDFWVNAFMSLVTGFQLDVFRSWSGGNHNTTICTGNLRTMGQLFYAELFHRTDATGKKALTYAGLLLSFPLGAAVGALLCLWLGVRASWVAGLFLLAWVLWMNMDEKCQAAGART